MEPIEDSEVIESPDRRRLIAAVCLGIFVMSSTVGGFCISVAAGFLALGVAALVASYLLGGE